MPSFRSDAARFARFSLCAALTVLAACATADSQRVSTTEVLRFSAPQGRILNEFFRDGQVAAHVVLTSGDSPRLVVAFPAGNSGTAVWFAADDALLQWNSDVSIGPLVTEISAGPLRGVAIDVSATGGPIRVQDAMVGSIRMIRAHSFTDLPAGLAVTPQRDGESLVWDRRRLDGGAGYRLSVEVRHGELRETQPGAFVLAPGTDGQLRLHVVALSGDAPLTPIPPGQLFTAQADDDAQLRNIFAFLAYREKLLAGSWQYETYFGRDTLMSLELMGSAVQTPIVEAGLRSVLERLNAAGEVAHEEDIGEFAVLRHRMAGEALNDAPVFDYKMVDDDFMLPIAAATYLARASEGDARAFLARRTSAGATYGELLERNFRFVLGRASAFAADPQFRNLVSLKSGRDAGNWRDSGEGLGGGRYPYDVNAILVPAALRAIAETYERGIIQGEAAPVFTAASVWLARAPALFDVEMSSVAARDRISVYAQRVGVDPAPALSALGTNPSHFRAVALSADGRPIPIINSDEAFALFLLDPPSEEVERIANLLSAPFPAGLMTDVGLLVADPVYAPDTLADQFGSSHYHGTVIWSWQQALFVAGLKRQLARANLTANARTAIERAQARVAVALQNASDMHGSELWAWSQTGGRYQVEQFGQRVGDATESNAAQLWSTVYLNRDFANARERNR